MNASLITKKYKAIRSRIAYDKIYNELKERCKLDKNLEIRESVSGSLYLGYKRG